jgi:Zn-dependent oligopeptidase
MAKADNRGPYILLSLYEKLYTQTYSKKPRLNKYREKWGMQEVIDEVGQARAAELLEYYFRTGKNGHPIQWFFYNFDRLDDMLTQQSEDAERRRRMREATKRLVEENS